VYHSFDTIALEWKNNEDNVPIQCEMPLDAVPPSLKHKGNKLFFCLMGHRTISMAGHSIVSNQSYLQ
jgi:hypothetical protein